MNAKLLAILLILGLVLTECSAKRIWKRYGGWGRRIRFRGRRFRKFRRFRRHYYIGDEEMNQINEDGSEIFRDIFKEDLE